MSVNDFEGNLTDPPLPYEHVIFTDLDGLEGVLVDLNTKKYYQLNETASLIWSGLEKRLPVSHIAKEMTERYDVTLERAVLSIETALRQFQAQKVIRTRKS
jgi:coenzyme PQQ synthesis protein D (PqqD)